MAWRKFLFFNLYCKLAIYFPSPWIIFSFILHSSYPTCSTHKEYKKSLTYCVSLGRELYSNNISGRVPSELGNLTNLVSLDLYLNGLSGPIPDTLGKLQKLRFLYVFLFFKHLDFIFMSFLSLEIIFSFSWHFLSATKYDIFFL